MKFSKETMRNVFLPLFSIVMGIIILLTQKDNPDFIISKHEYIFAGISLILIGLGLFFMRMKKP